MRYDSIKNHGEHYNAKGKQGTIRQMVLKQSSLRMFWEKGEHKGIVSGDARGQEDDDSKKAACLVNKPVLALNPINKIRINSAIFLKKLKFLQFSLIPVIGIAVHNIPLHT